MPEPTQHVLSVQPGGIVEGLFMEAIDLHELGPLHLTRASTIEFNAVSQQWEVRVEDSTNPLFADISRQACLDWEQQHFNALLLNSPVSPPSSSTSITMT